MVSIFVHRTYGLGFYCLGSNSLRRVIEGIIQWSMIGRIKRDARSLDYSSYGDETKVQGNSGITFENCLHDMWRCIPSYEEDFRKKSGLLISLHFEA